MLLGVCSYLVLGKQWEVKHNFNGLRICCHDDELRHASVERFGCCGGDCVPFDEPLCGRYVPSLAPLRNCL